MLRHVAMAGASVALGRRVPLSITVEVTNRCNAHCRYCDPTRSGGSEMSTAQIIGLMDTFRALGTQRVGFTGGEPTLRDDLGTLLRHAKKTGMISTVSTNGLLVPERIGQFEPASLVMVSLDGPRALHDGLRGAGTYDRSLAAIAALKRAGIPVISSTVVTRLNSAELDHVLDLGRERGFACIFALLFSQHNRSVRPEEHARLAARDHESRRVYAELLAKKRAGAPVVNSRTYLRYMAEARYLHQPVRCEAARRYCAIGSDGSLASCGLHLGPGEHPNGLELGFEEAWERLDRAPCDRAYCNFGVEQSMMLRVRPESVFNFLRWFGRL